MLIKQRYLNFGASEPIAFACSRWLAACFRYQPDDFNPELMMADKWPTKMEVLANIESNNGILVGDCDDHAYAAAYGLAEINTKARVHVCFCETGEMHAVCEDEFGHVIDNRFPGRVCTWEELERVGYRRYIYSGFFMFGESQWSKFEPAVQAAPTPPEEEEKSSTQPTTSEGDEA